VDVTAKKAAYAALFTALTAIGAFIRIPMPLVPFSMQTFFVYMSGTLLGASAGFMSQLAYLLLGLAGLPIFTQGGGIGYVIVPTFGYLLAHPPAALVIGKLSESINFTMASAWQVFLRIFLVICSGAIIIYGTGTVYLYICSRFFIGKEISFTTALWTGFVIFIPVSLVKILMATYLTLKIKRNAKILLP